MKTKGLKLELKSAMRDVTSETRGRSLKEQSDKTESELEKLKQEMETVEAELKQLRSEATRTKQATANAEQLGTKQSCRLEWLEAELKQHVTEVERLSASEHSLTAELRRVKGEAALLKSNESELREQVEQAQRSKKDDVAARHKSDEVCCCQAQK